MQTLSVNDKDIIVANNVTGGANVNGAGIQAGNPGVATWFFNNATTSWQSNIGITPTANGTLSLGGSSNYWGSAFVTTISATGNANVGNIGATNAVFTNIAGTLTTASQPNITSVGTLGSLAVTANIVGGNLTTAGQVVATGNVSGGNLNVTGNIVDTGPMSLVTGSSGNVNLAPNGTNVLVATTTGANITGTLNATGNANVGNLGTVQGVFTGNVGITLANAAFTVTDSFNTASAVKTIRAASGVSKDIFLSANLGAGSYNSLTAVSDAGIITTGTALGNANLVIAPWASATSGIRISSVSNVATITIAATTINNAGNVFAIGNIQGANIVSNSLVSTVTLSATGNATVANLNLSGNIVDTGALSLITGSSGNVSLAPNGTNVLVATTTGANITGTLNATGNANVGNLGTAGQITATGNITASGNVSGGNILGNGYNLTGINTFSSIAVTGANTVVADSIADTLTLVAGTGITIVTDSTTDTITIAAASSGSEIFVDGADFGTIEEAVTITDDLGLITETLSSQADLGEIVISGVFYPNQLVLPSVTVSTLPSATIPAQMIYVSNESGGAVPAFSDGTNWRRVTDRAIVT